MSLIFKYKWLIIVSLLIVIPWGGCKYFVYSHHISLVPDAMNVSRILHVSEKAWGWGPGGNETGIIVYEMPDIVTSDLKKKGLLYLATLPTNVGRKGRFTQWYPTPILSHKRWQALQQRNEGVSRGIRDYLFRYGFYIPLESKIEEMVNKAILNEGSYFSYGRNGIIILIPHNQKIVYVYSG